MSKYSFSPDQLATVKNISILDYLYSLGYKETHTANNKKDYFFDLSESGKKTGDTHVDTRKNLFFSFSEEKGGDIIQLVQLLHKYSFVEAVKALSGHSPTPLINTRSTAAPKPIRTAGQVNQLTELSKIQILTQYANSRGISTDTLRRSEVLFLSETVATGNEKKSFFFLGLKNDKGGFAIRNKALKGMRGNTDITTITKGADSPYIVVEGMFEYLTVLEATKQFDLNFIVLNSTVNAQGAIYKINSLYADFIMMLNNDDSGRRATDMILAATDHRKVHNVNFEYSDDLNTAIQSEGGLLFIKNLLAGYSIKGKKN